MTRSWKIIANGLALALVLTIAACQSADTTGPDMASAIDSAEVRTDREPIADRFPQLGSFIDAHWVGGRLGDDQMPGPSTYFIEAVVMLDPDDLARLADRYEFTRVPAPPRPPAALAQLIEGSSAWSTSAELEAGFGPSDWSSNVFVSLDDGVAYVSARGE